MSRYNQHHVEHLERRLAQKESEHKQTVAVLCTMLVTVIVTAAVIGWNMNQDRLKLLDKHFCATEYVEREGLEMCKHQAESQVEQAAIDAGIAE